jgi:hypothetical protein
MAKRSRDKRLLAGLAMATAALVSHPVTSSAAPPVNPGHRPGALPPGLRQAPGLRGFLPPGRSPGALPPGRRPPGGRILPPRPPGQRQGGEPTLPPGHRDPLGEFGLEELI